jgi:hypothetical protein
MRRADCHRHEIAGLRLSVEGSAIQLAGSVEHWGQRHQQVALSTR